MITEQEKFWKGEFGTDYAERARKISKSKSIKIHSYLLSNVLSKTSNIKSVLEFGANIGMNLFAIKSLMPDSEISAVEINSTAVNQLKKIKGLKVYHQSLLDFDVDYQRDLVFTSGVLIHIAPDKLEDVYKLLFDSSKKYICMIEYYNPAPVEINYRGYKKKLFKRDFAGEILDKYKSLKLLDYGFFYHRDKKCFFDDLNWFLLEKK